MSTAPGPGLSSCPMTCRLKMDVGYRLLGANGSISDDDGGLEGPDGALSAETAVHC